MDKEIKLGEIYNLDVGSSSSIKVRPTEFLEHGIKCDYLLSFPGRTEVLYYEMFRMNGYVKPFDN